MGELIQFSDYCGSCKMCANLQKVDKCTYICTEMQWSDGTTVYPIENGVKTDGYNICHGEEFVKRELKGVKYGKRRID